VQFDSIDQLTESAQAHGDEATRGMELDNIDQPTKSTQAPGDEDARGEEQEEQLGHGHHHRESSVRLRDYIIHTV